jgi:hypothetical protein
MKHYLTNMDNHLRPIVEEAIQLSGRSDIHIDNEPMPAKEHGIDIDDYYTRIRPQLIGRLFSIYVSSDSRDAGDFWDTYRRSLDSNRWKTYLTLVYYEDLV